jgi:ubiquinone/menaquinone biosynthesis C-methylase UbiE
MSGNWRDAAQMFFDERASALSGKPTLSGLSYISGRDARLWSDAAMYEDLISSILQQLAATKTSKLLEVGSASGFLAWGLAPRVTEYVGVDVAAKAVRLGNRLGLANAEFRVADGASLPFPESSFDAVVCYDVFTNFPSFDPGAKIIAEMVRVLRPGGRALVGSIPDALCKEAFEERVKGVSADLDQRYGPLSPATNARLGMLARLRRVMTNVSPGISCYYFRREDFAELGERLGADVSYCDLHPLNPYYGLRFNALFNKPKA